MKVLGISLSPREQETTSQVVQAVLAGASGAETEFVSLAGKRINACVACLGCVETNNCVIKDDMAPIREQILAADALVIGGCNYFKGLNALGRCFMERFYQFRHREAMLVAGKPVVLVGVGGGSGEEVVEDLKIFCMYNQMDCVDTLTARGAACCFVCGYGEDCKVGAIVNAFGEDTKITDDMIPALDKQPDVRAAAAKAGAALVQRVRDFGSDN
jgi:multimeric flavodoxin WrbA